MENREELVVKKKMVAANNEAAVKRRESREAEEVQELMSSSSLSEYLEACVGISRAKTSIVIILKAMQEFHPETVICQSRVPCALSSKP